MCHCQKTCKWTNKKDINLLQTAQHRITKDDILRGPYGGNLKPHHALQGFFTCILHFTIKVLYTGNTHFRPHIDFDISLNSYDPVVHQLSSLFRR